MMTHLEPELPETGPVSFTADDVAQIDFDLFDSTGVDLPHELRSSRPVLDLLDPPVPGRPAEDESQMVLFDVGEPCAPTPTLSPESIRRLRPIVARAYADVREDKSVDYCVAEPEANLLFLNRCWELGAAASPFELNWVLMNARKANHFEDLELSRSARTSIPRDRLDLFAFASDMAMRHLQDRVYSEDRRDVSIDKILCEPHLAREFDKLARLITPGFSSFEYRWAAISLRKARRSKPRSSPSSCFTSVGYVEDLSIQKLSDRSGVYWITEGENSLFMGVANNLRTQCDSLIQRLGFRIVPEWMEERPKVKPVLHVHECPHTMSKQTHAALLLSRGSRLNFRMCDIGGGSAVRDRTTLSYSDDSALVA